MNALLRLVYALLLYLAAPFVLLRLLWKSRLQPAYRRRIGERFGVVPRSDGVAVWVHAVSVGETLAAVPLIEALIGRHGERRVWVTTTTPTGSERVLAAFGTRVHHSYVPYDLPDAVARFLTRVRPQRALIMETELWPTLFRACAQRGIPLMIANGRLSVRSFRGYGRFRSFFAEVLNDCAIIAAQSAADRERFLALGTAASKVADAGNIKFDVDPPMARLVQGRELRCRLGTQRPVWIAASTHPGEESAAVRAHQRVLQRFADAALILVPRHPQRFDEVLRSLQGSGLQVSTRSALADAGTPDELAGVQWLFGDSMGEMFMYLAMADVAFVGGSLVPIGGHNVLEPAAIGLPVLFGPHMSNFVAARDLLLQAGAAQQVVDADGLASALIRLFADAEQRRSMGQAGEAAVTANRGAKQRLLDLIEALPAKRS